MAGMDYWLDRKYAMLQDQATQPPAPVAPVAAAPVGSTIADPFAKMAAGTTRSFGSFTGQQVGAPGAGGTTIVRGSSSPLGMADLLRTQGLTPEQATARIVGAADAGLDTTKAALLPAESQAVVAKSGAETGLINQQAKLLPGETAARIANLGANSYATRIGGDVAKKEGLTGQQDYNNFIQGILGVRGVGDFMRQFHFGTGFGP